MDATHHTVLERIARHDRAVLIVMLVAVPLACWSGIVPMARDMYGSMSGQSAWMMTDVWDGPHLLLLGAMWFVMMAGMMLPSAAPTLLLYGVPHVTVPRTVMLPGGSTRWRPATFSYGLVSAWARRFFSECSARCCSYRR